MVLCPNSDILNVANINGIIEEFASKNERKNYL